MEDSTILNHFGLKIDLKDTKPWNKCI